ncbi:MAG: thymidine kinase [Candidatus Limiplasma sp.]|nr:thymidine kinase [Candidatus Limiplasma sp.]MEA5144656.1 thymidine kinase [Candidatus Limiplasma sp.]
MAKLYYRYGAMGSSKTANAIMVRHNYLERNQRVLMVKPRLDRRDGANLVASRSGLTCECNFVEELAHLNVRDYDCVIVDEAQFMTKAQVEYLVHVVDELNVPVIAYGLRADFRGEFFEGSKWLMAWADTIEEIKTICWCGKKATFNARVVDGKVAKTGEQIVLGGSESYTSLCRRHWQEGNLGDGAHRKLEME